MEIFETQLFPHVTTLDFLRCAAGLAQCPKLFDFTYLVHIPQTRLTNACLFGIRLNQWRFSLWVLSGPVLAEDLERRGVSQNEARKQVALARAAGWMPKLSIFCPMLLHRANNFEWVRRPFCIGCCPSSATAHILLSGRSWLSRPPKTELKQHGTKRKWLGCNFHSCVI